MTSKILGGPPYSQSFIIPCEEGAGVFLDLSESFRGTGMLLLARTRYVISTQNWNYVNVRRECFSDL